VGVAHHIAQRTQLEKTVLLYKHPPRWDIMLKAVADTLPEAISFCHSAYAAPTHLKYGTNLIQSAEGVQQGDPFGPLLFCLTVHPLLSSLLSPMAFGYLDDFTLGGPADIVASDVEMVRAESGKLGLYLNERKCELIGPMETEVPITLRTFIRVAPGDVTLLGSPLIPGPAMDSSHKARCEDPVMLSLGLGLGLALRTSF